MFKFKTYSNWNFMQYEMLLSTKGQNSHVTEIQLEIGTPTTAVYYLKCTNNDTNLLFPANWVYQSMNLVLF